MSLASMKRFSIARFLIATLWLGCCAFVTQSAMADQMPVNGGFETGDLTGWTASGDAFTSPMSIQQVQALPNAPNLGQWEGNYVMCSLLNGEATTGSLLSDPVLLTEEAPWLEFLIAGYSDHPGTPDNEQWCYFRVLMVQGENLVQVARAYAPNSNTMKRIRVDGSSLIGATIRFEIVDNAGINAYAWICVDDIKLVASPTLPPMVDGMLFENAGFESGDFIQWTAEGAAFQDVCAVGSVAHSPNFVGKFAANTYMFGETSTGTLTSDPFTLESDVVSFLMCGWRAAGGGAANQWNYVSLSVIDDSTETPTLVELGRVYAPNSNEYTRKQIKVESSNIGKQAVIKVVDDAAEAGFAWLGVDDFLYKTFPTPAPADPYIPNNSFELGLTNWTAEGAAFANMPTDDQSSPHIPDLSWDGRYWVNTVINGEPATGSLTSDPFILQTPAISFLINGYSSAPPFTNSHNYIALYAVGADLEVARVYPPNVNTLVRRYFSAPSMIGKEVYIKLVDDNSGSGYAWVGVDDFRSEDAGGDYPWTAMVNKADTAPVIDGLFDASEWKTQRVDITMNSLALYGGTKLVGNVTDDSDLSGHYYFMWDNDALYVAAQVRDNKVEVWSNQGQALNSTDAIQLCLDPLLYRGVDTNGGVSIHDVTPGQKDNPDAAAYWQHWPTEGALYPNAQYASSRTSDGYIIELKLPWSDFPEGTTATAGTKMGYLALLLDTDSPATATEQVVHELMYNGGNGQNIIGNPSQWQYMTLVEASDDVTPIISVTGITLNYNNAVRSAYVGDEIALVATVTPEDADTTAVTWSTSNAAAATVDANGLVKAVGVGGAVITATTVDGGLTATMRVRVENPVAAGSLFVSEIFINGPGNDDGKEWFEVYNATDSNININGWELRSNGSNGTIESIYINNPTAVTIPARGHAVLGQSADMMTSAGVPFVYAYGITETFKLSNEFDEIIILQAGRVVDAFGYGPDCKSEPIELMHKMDFTLEQMAELERNAAGLSGDYRRGYAGLTWTIQTSVFGQMPNNSMEPKDCTGTPGAFNDAYVPVQKVLEVSHTPATEQYATISAAYAAAFDGDAIEIVDNSAPFEEAIMFNKAKDMTLRGKAGLDPKPVVSDAKVTKGNGITDTNPDFAFFIQPTVAIVFENVEIQANVSGAPLDLRSGGPYSFINSDIFVGNQPKAWTGATGGEVLFAGLPATEQTSPVYAKFENGGSQFIALGGAKLTVRYFDLTGKNTILEARDSATVDAFDTTFVTSEGTHVIVANGSAHVNFDEVGLIGANIPLNFDGAAKGVIVNSSFSSENAGEGVLLTSNDAEVVFTDSELNATSGRIFYARGAKTTFNNCYLYNVNGGEVMRIDNQASGASVDLVMTSTTVDVKPRVGNALVVQQNAYETTKPVTVTIDHSEFSCAADEDYPTTGSIDSAIIVVAGVSGLNVTNTVFHHWSQMIAILPGAEDSVKNLHESWNVFHQGVPIFSNLVPMSDTDVVIPDNAQVFVDTFTGDFRLNGYYETELTNDARPGTPKYPGSWGFGPVIEPPAPTNAAGHWTAFE